MATEKYLKIMKNAIQFTLKALFFLEIFIFLSWLFGHVENDLIRKIKFKIYDVTTRETNNWNINIVQYLKK